MVLRQLESPNSSADSISEERNETESTAIHSTNSQTTDIKVVIDNIFNHSLKQVKSPDPYDPWIQVGTFAESLVASYNYLLPAWKYASEDGGLLVSDNPILNAGGIVTLSLFILMNSMQIFLRWMKEEKLPDQIQQYFTQKSRWRTVLDNAFVFLGSAASSLPLALTYVVYTKDSLPVRVVLSIVIEIANTLLHFLPYKLILSNPFYGAPFWLLGGLISYLIACVRKTETSLSPEERKQLENVTLLLNRLADALSVLSQTAASESLQKEGCLFYQVQLVDDLNISLTQDTLCNLVPPINTHEPENLPAISNGKPWWDVPVRVFGASWVALGNLGYTANPFTLFSKTLKSTVYGSLVAVFPAYAFTVLLAFFGESMAHDAASTLSAISKGQDIRSIEAKQFPLFFLLMLGVGVYCGFFSYSAGLQVKKDNFDSETYGLFSSILGWAAISSLFFLSLFASKDAFIWMSQKYVSYWGSEEQKDLNYFREASTMTTERIKRIEPKQALEMFQDTANDTFFESVGITRKEIDETLSPEKRSTTGCLSQLTNLWRKTPKIFNGDDEEREQLLINRSLEIV